MYAGIGVGGGVDTLLLVEVVSFPIGELSVLGDALAEEVCPEFLQAEVLYAHAGGEVLEVNPSGGMETLMAM